MTNRRLPRSTRAFGAIVLLMTAVVAAVVGIVLATVPALITVTAYAVVAGVVAARLLSNEIAHLRREWARDRASLADDHRVEAISRSSDHIAFAAEMGSRVTSRDAQIATLRDDLVTAEIELAQARERVSAERARSEALLAEVDTATSDLESAQVDLRRATDALAASESAELQVRAELLAWEEAAANGTQRDRKLA